MSISKQNSSENHPEETLQGSEAEKPLDTSLEKNRTVRRASEEAAAGTPNQAVSKAGRGVWKTVVRNSRALQILAIVFIVQLLFAAGLYWNSSREHSLVTAETLVAVDQSLVDSIEIDGEDRQLQLLRTPEGWQLQGEPIMPADNAKVDELLAQLSDLKVGLPVATTAGAQEQLEVAEDKYQRHLRLQQGEKTLAELYVGTSPGYRRAHVRSAGENAIVAAQLNVYDIPTEADGWMDQKMLAFSDINRIQTDDFTLAKVDERWTIEAPDSLREGREVDEARLDTVLAALEGLTVNGVADEYVDSLADDPQVVSEDATPDVKVVETESTSSASTEGSDETALVVSWIVTENDAEPLTLSVTQQGSEVTVTRSDWPLRFKASPSVFDTLNDVDIDTLLPVLADPDATSEAITSTGKEGGEASTSERSNE